MSSRKTNICKPNHLILRHIETITVWKCRNEMRTEFIYSFITSNAMFLHLMQIQKRENIYVIFHENLSNGDYESHASPGALS